MFPLALRQEDYNPHHAPRPPPLNQNPAGRRCTLGRVGRKRVANEAGGGRGGRGRKGRARAARRGGAFKPGGARSAPRLRTAAATSLRVGAAGVCRGGRGSPAGRGVAIATARMEAGGGGEEAAGGGGGGGGAEGPAGLVTEIRAPGPRPLRLLEWKVSVGAAVQIGSVLALCAPLPPAPRPAAPPGAGAATTATATAGSPRPQRAAAERKLKAERPGVVRELCARPGQVVAPG